MAEYIDREAARELLELAVDDDWELSYAGNRLADLPAADKPGDCTKTCICCEYAICVMHDFSDIEITCINLNDVADVGLWGMCTEFKAVNEIAEREC